ncbi:hypothetical protein BGI41_05565 [Methanobrevibacter sp. 87.7]|uniref:AAA family ATPase n=1 Tax=Methanobrevibacter sp. 87.7 TaxID=387957 RepID=UPI000B730F02|nr:AAA family ATPase [Methanobrevibacter sp. 87.7]OWT32832.1 hypothetical protein BGI41_05565 [Methanobrevibacter sp. 87.7]
MIFDSLHLKNFKSHADTKIDFNPGISLIVGENGAGKSTILEAISFALFKQHNSKTIKDLVRNSKGNASATMNVSLEFTSNGNHYKVERSHTKSSSKAVLYQKFYNKSTKDYQYQIMCENDKNVNSEIKSILQIDSDLFLNAIYIRQGEIAELVSKSPAEKKKLIAKLLGIDSLEKAWENIKPLINDYENKEAELKGRLVNKDNVDVQIKDNKLAYTNLKNEKLEIDGKIKQVKINKDELAKQKQVLDVNRLEYTNIKNRIDNESNDVKRLKHEKSELQFKLDEINTSEKEMKRLEKYVRKLPVYLHFEECSRKILELNKEKEDFEKDLKMVKNHQEILNKYKPSYEKYNKFGDELEKLFEEKAKADSQFELLNKIIFDNNELKKEIKEDTASLDSFNRKLVSTIENETEYTDVDNKSPDEITKILNKIISDLEKSLVNIDEEVKNKTNEIATSKEAINSCEKPLNDLKNIGNKCPICQSDISNQKKLDLEREYKEKIISSRNKINKDEKDIAILKDKKDIVKSKKDTFNDLSNELAANKYLIDRLIKNSKKYEENSHEIEAKKHTKDNLLKINSDIEDVRLKRKESKEGYDQYVGAKKTIDTYSSENDIKNKINQNRDEFDHTVRLIQIDINKDAHLSADISEQELRDRIEDLKRKETKFNQLKGFIKVKSSYESQISSKKESLKFKEANLEKLSKDIKNISYDEEKYNTVVSNLTIIEDKLTNLNKDSSKYEGQIKVIKSNLDNLIKEQNEYTSLLKDYNDVQTFISYLVEIRSLFSKDGIQEDLRKLSRPTIQKYTKEFFEEFNFDYSDLILDDDFNVSLYGPEGESSLDMVSGGERIAIALALRLGITKSMSNGIMETILLDEPTIHLDSYRRHELIDLLRKMSSLPQMIIVTHDEELESAADTIIKIKKELGVSRLVKDD